MRLLPARDSPTHRQAKTDLPDDGASMTTTDARGQAFYVATPPESDGPYRYVFARHTQTKPRRCGWARDRSGVFEGELYRGPLIPGMGWPAARRPVMQGRP